MSSPGSSSVTEATGNEPDIISYLIGDEEEKWRNTRGQFDIINQLADKGESPLSILKNYFKVDFKEVPTDPLELWSCIFHLVMEGPQRKRIESINTFQQALDLIKASTNIIVLTGAGISVPCGVPDFRSRNGIYSRLAVDFPDLDEPQSMFDINYFVKNPRPFFKFAKEIYPGNFQPSLGHKFIKLLEDKNKLLRNYTQNIDTIEMIAGIQNIIQCHGSFSMATCMRCHLKVDGKSIKDDIMRNEIPICTSCTNEEERNIDNILKLIEGEESVDRKNLLPILKPDIVFFGEGLPKDFHATITEDKLKADLLIVIGSSLKVRPVAHIPGCLPSHVPQILINKELLTNHKFDVELLGDCDVIVKEICRRLGFLNDLIECPDENLVETDKWIEKELDDLKSEIINDYTEAIQNSEEDTVKCGETKNENTETIQNSEEGVVKCEDAKVELSDDIKTDSVMNENSTDQQVEDVKEIGRVLCLSEYLRQGVNAIRVPPNRYVFAGAEYYIDSLNLDEVCNLNTHESQYDSSISSEEGETSNDDTDSNDNEEVAEVQSLCNEILNLEEDPPRKPLKRSFSCDDIDNGHKSETKMRRINNCNENNELDKSLNS